MSEQLPSQLPSPEAGPQYANWPAPVVPDALTPEPAAGLSRRTFVIGGAATAVIAVVSGAAVAVRSGVTDRVLGLGEDSDIYDPMPKTLDIPGEESTSKDGPAAPELPAYRTKEGYTLADLTEYARNTDFAENDPAKLSETIRQIESAEDRQELERLTKEAMRRMTGRELYFNRLPGTEETLPDTRPDTDLTLFRTNMALFIQRIGTLPRQLVSRPSDYNIIEDFLPSVTSDGRSSVDPNIGGQVLHTAESDHLSMDVFALSDFSTLAHELMHVGQFLTGAEEYMQSGAYSQLRARGVQQFGSVQDMHIALENRRDEELAADNENFIPVADLAYTLIRSEDSAPDVRLEDEAYTLGATVRSGLLPEMPDDELFTYLRDKQLQALDDMSALAGADFGAVLAFSKRFGDVSHPKTLASIAEAGVPNLISDAEGGPLAQHEPWKINPLTPGTHFVNIGTSDKPELVMLAAVGTAADTADPSNAFGLYDLVLAYEASRESLDLREVPPTTTTLPANEMAEPEITVEQLPILLSNDEQFAQDIVSAFAPDLVVNQDFQIYTDSAPFAYGEHFDAFTIRVELNAGITYRAIDRSKLYGRIDDAGLFEAF